MPSMAAHLVVHGAIRRQEGRTVDYIPQLLTCAPYEEVPYKPTKLPDYQKSEDYATPPLKQEVVPQRW